MKSKKFVLVGFVLLAIAGLLALTGCKNDSVPPEATSGTETKPVTHTVTFNANGGTFADGKDTKTETVESGQTATRPEPDPTKANWVFAGWYTLKDDGETLADTAYSFDTPVEGDITLYAAWNGVGDDGSIVLGNKVIPKTSEVQVLSGEVYLSSLEVSSSEVFISGRGGEIQPFVMGQYEVTQQLYFAVMKEWGGTSKPSDTYGEGDEYPAYYVSWYDAVVFCNELSELMGLEPVYSKGGTTDTNGWGEVPTSSTNDTWKDAITCDFTKSGYRLPTEAEWELAARGGNPGADAWQYTYAGTNEEDELKANYAWYSSNSDSKTHEVGTMTANGLKLYDMSGNVWEWCWDWNGSIDAGTPSGGAASGSFRVSRGGSWGSSAGNCAVCLRFGVSPYNRSSSRGFRLVRSAN